MRSMKTNLKIGGALAAGLLVAACNAGAAPTASPDPTASPSAAPAAGPNGTYVSTGVTDDGADMPLVPNSNVTLSFQDGQLSANAGCNTMNGSYSVESDQLLVSTLASTQMACEEPLKSQDEWLATFLDSDPTFALSGDVLTLTSGATVMTLNASSGSDQALTGTTWLLNSVISGGPDGAAVSIPEGVEATLVFNDDGSVDVSPGCNTGSGTYTVAGEVITFGPIALTRMACAGPAGEVENDVLIILGTETVQYTIDDAGALTLRDSDGNGLIFTAQ